MVTGGDMSMQQTCMKWITATIYTPTAACMAKGPAESLILASTVKAETEWDFKF